MSSEIKDPSIKLFGTMISVPLQCSPDISGKDQDSSKTELKPPEQDGDTSHQTTEDLKSPTSSGVSESPETFSPSAEREDSVLKPTKSEEQSETSTQQEKTPKKPDKILPCPRCNSMETKFCYFNNYNVNQPRHFCKKCQRYWTAGGTMRNVPVGAGRRKNKSSCASHYRHIVIPESLITAANVNGLQNTVLRNGSTVLTFGSSDSALCNPMASVADLTEKTQNGVVKGVHVSKQNTTVSCGREDNGDDHSVGASVTTPTSLEKKANTGSQKSVKKTYEGFPPQLQCTQNSPWQYSWNSLVPPPVLSPGYPVSFFPTPAYWSCSLPASLNIACVSPQSSVKNPSSRSTSDSPNSRKHSRDGSILAQVNSQREKHDAERKDLQNSVLIPKTLRIDDPTEAAKSSIRSTLGIKNKKANNPFNGCVGLFNAIPSKGNGQNYHPMVEVLAVLHANPAALSRSVAFHEQQA